MADPTAARSARTDVVATLRSAGCVFAEEEAALLLAAAAAGGDLGTLVARRTAGEPLEHVLGWASFAGLRIRVEAGVFVPRRRTELLVREAVAGPPPGAGPPVVVELCCGSGAVAAAVLHRWPGAEVHVADLDPAALRCARVNLPAAHAHEGDLYDPLPGHLRGRVDVLLANAPYVPTADLRLLPPEAREHEPALALDGGADGLAVLRRVVAGAPRWLAPGGRLLVEASERQSADLLAAVAAAGLYPRVVADGATGATVVVGTAPGALLS
ncbi:putative protein N(5)-glutamine methyltransferase [Georgenia faecalis]|uniref:putative protein N(5)-glutamine methyltransferase n=1 Tax=Georgenia faecalis TaxID=2483799 RepID=UPI000FDB5F6A|nr:putative protein N(5)-glutamine methyltransferase [Georgenia faecalis]